MDIDVLISQAHRRIEVSRGELVDAIDSCECSMTFELMLAQHKHDKNVKRLRELMDEKFPETVGEW
jgi:hypothetical protein